MKNRTRNYSMAALAVVVIACAGWYFGSPRWDLWQMGQAAQAQDADKLSEYVDYSAFRSSLKEEMKAKMLLEATKQQNPFATLGIMFVDQMVDSTVTPATVRSIFENAKKEHPATKQFGMNTSGLVYERKGLSEFWLVDPKGGPGGALVFKRDGLGWKLSAIRLPDGAISDWAK